MAKKADSQSASTTVALRIVNGVEPTPTERIFVNETHHVTRHLPAWWFSVETICL
jgi:hypothetical protein